MRKSCFLILTLFIFLPGCFRRSICVFKNSCTDRQAIPNRFAHNKSFSVTGSLHINGNEQKDDLQAKELAQKIALVLQNKGYSIKQPDCADYHIHFQYGLNSETKTVNVAKCIPGQTITHTSSLESSQGHEEYEEQTRTSDTYVYMPEEQTSHKKMLNLGVYDANNQQVPKVWQCATWGIDDYADLRRYSDFLIVNSLQSFGHDTQGTNATYMYENDAEVASLRQAYLDT